MQTETAETTMKAGFDPHDVDAIAGQDWETVLQRFTEDMDPWAIDIVTLAERYKSYIDRMERFELTVPGRVILICAVLLRMKTEIVRDLYGEDAEQEAEEEMAAMFGELDDEEWEEVEDEAQLRIPEAVPTPPVKRRSVRKVTLDELKGALEKALHVQERREERQEERRDEDYGVEVEEDDITDRLNSLYNRLKAVLGAGREAVTFSDIVEDEARTETLDRFVHIMHLETDQRVRCMQEEWLGEIEIEVLEEENDEKAA